MATRSASRHRSIPISVTVERRSSQKGQPTPAATAQSVIRNPLPATAWPEARRRRMMWISVGIGTFAVLIGWMSFFPAELRGTSPTFFGDVARMVRDIRWPWEKAPVAPQAQEIRQLEEQVFPQFQK